MPWQLASSYVRPTRRHNIITGSQTDCALTISSQTILYTLDQCELAVFRRSVVALSECAFRAFLAEQTMLDNIYKT